MQYTHFIAGGGSLYILFQPLIETDEIGTQAQSSAVAKLPLMTMDPV